MPTAMTCQVPGCGHTEADWMADHLVEAHGLTVEAYLADHPGAPTVSQRLLDRLADEQTKRNVRRALPPDAQSLTVAIGPIEFPIHRGVPAEACLPEPEEYALPCHGELGRDILNALVGLKRNRSLYIWGLPGSGKDALFHYWSARTRTPAIIRQMVPGTDIESWFFSRGFNEQGTEWEEGDVLVALRDGYLTEDGTRIPYLLLVSDLDRADRAQAEHLRLITDSIQGRVGGPAGKTYRLLKGAQIVATANTAGSGDPRGRMVSSNPLDASILDRFERKYMFHWMDWKDEEPIVRAKFPLLVERAPAVFPAMGKVTEALRKAIQGNDLFAEFSHRGLCAILGHAEDMLICNRSNKVPDGFLKRAARAWLDGLPDPDTREAAVRIIDAHVKGGMVDEGSKGHIADDPLDPSFK